MKPLPGGPESAGAAQSAATDQDNADAKAIEYVQVRRSSVWALRTLLLETAGKI